MRNEYTGQRKVLIPCNSKEQADELCKQLNAGKSGEVFTKNGSQVPDSEYEVTCRPEAAVDDRRLQEGSYCTPLDNQRP